MEKDKVQSESLTVRIESKTVEVINRMAALNGASKSYITRQLILEGIANADKIKIKVE
jgi:hypothetical protein